MPIKPETARILTRSMRAGMRHIAHGQPHVLAGHTVQALIDRGLAHRDPHGKLRLTAHGYQRLEEPEA